MTPRHGDSQLIDLLAHQPEAVFCGTASAEAWPDRRAAIELRGGEYLALAAGPPNEPLWNVITTACPLRTSLVILRGNGDKDLLWVGPGAVLKPVNPLVATLLWCGLLNSYPGARLHKSEAWAALTARAATCAV